MSSTLSLRVAIHTRIITNNRFYPNLKFNLDALHTHNAFLLSLCPFSQVFVEYVVLAGVNDGLAQAHELGALLQGTSMLCNLIPW